MFILFATGILNIQSIQHKNYNTKRNKKKLTF